MPETKLPIAGGNEGLLAALTDKSEKRREKRKGKVHTQFRDPPFDLRGAQLWNLNRREAICTWLSLQGPKSPATNGVLVAEAQVIFTIGSGESRKGNAHNFRRLAAGRDGRTAAVV
jgi:hypothetical protein